VKGEPQISCWTGRQFHCWNNGQYHWPTTSQSHGDWHYVDDKFIRDWNLEYYFTNQNVKL